jgi:hypothetical protein
MSIKSDIVAAISQFFSGVKPLNWPRPLECKQFPMGNVTVGDGLFVPDLLAGDGSGWLYVSNGSLVRIGPTGTTIYTIAIAEIDANASTIAIFPDYANNRLWILGFWAGNMRLAWTPRATKAITQVPAGAHTFAATAYMHLARAANGVDFLVYMTNQSLTAPLVEVATVNAATGVVSAAAPFRLGGVSVFATQFSYVTADSAVVANIRNQTHIVISRGGGFAQVALGATNMGTQISANSVHGFLVNGDAVTRYNNTNDGFLSMPKHFPRADLDAFLHRVADWAGLPR